MNWKLRFFSLLVLSIPSFTGYPVQSFDHAIIPGATFGWVIYLCMANAAILILLGRRHFMDVISLASLLTMPVVFVGSTISYGIYWAGLGYPEGPSQYSPHYLSLCLTMLTVIPLSISLVAVIPFHELESALLIDKSNVSGFEKCLLMFLRVFNHVIYFVIPNIIEVMREERRFAFGRDIEDRSDSDQGCDPAIGRRSKWIKRLIRDMHLIGIESICASVRYIPLWAVEISQLPKLKDKSDETPIIRS